MRQKTLHGIQHAYSTLEKQEAHAGNPSCDIRVQMQFPKDIPKTDG